jgi:hypothetical protein
MIINLHANKIRNKIQVLFMCLLDKIHTYLHIKTYLNCWKCYKFNDYECIKHNLISIGGVIFLISYFGSWLGNSNRPSDSLRPDSPSSPLYNGYEVSCPKEVRGSHCHSFALTTLTYLSLT